MAHKAAASEVDGLHALNIQSLRLLDSGMAAMKVRFPLSQIVWSDIDARAWINIGKV